MKTRTKLQVLVLYCYLCIYSAAGDPVVYPPFEFRRVPREMEANKLSFPNSNFPPYHVPQQQIIHTSAMQSQAVPTLEKVQTENPSYTMNRFLNAMSEFSGLNEEENQKLRASNSVHDANKFKLSSSNPSYPSYPSYPSAPSIPSLDSWTPAIHDPASIYAPSTSIQHQSSKATPKFNILEPITTKMSSKASGLMGLILSLLGSGSDNLLAKGFKDVLIDGVIRPLLVAKGGLKVLISKLSIPVVALVLVNVEILIVVWWLWWDDCPQQQQHPPPAYPQQMVDNYSYNTTYSYK